MTQTKKHKTGEYTVRELAQIYKHSPSYTCDLTMVKRYVRLAQVDLELIARKASPADNWRL
jgi:hypothetical protein